MSGGEWQRAAEVRVRIATWNLGRPRARQESRRRRIGDWLRRIDADIWVLTETGGLVTPGAEFRSVVTAESDREQEDGEAWATVWSRWPIQCLVASADPARTVAARVEPPGWPPLIVFASVLPWPGSRWRGVPAAGGAAFAAALRAQATDWRRLRAEIGDGELIVAGDLNQDLAGAYRRGSKANRAALAGALAGDDLVCLTAGAGDPLEGQTGGKWPGIDHICASRGLASRAVPRRLAWPPGGEPEWSLSDHFGVAVEFVAPAPATARRWYSERRS